MEDFLVGFYKLILSGKVKIVNPSPYGLDSIGIGLYSIPVIGSLYGCASGGNVCFSFISIGNQILVLLLFADSVIFRKNW